MPFARHHIYPLLETTRFDDAFGRGFDHALLADYGPISPETYVHDAWILSADGQVHPGLDRSPVPVRLEDVDVARDRLFGSPRR